MPRYIGVPAERIKARRALGDNPEVVEYIRANRNAIAFLSIGATDSARQRGFALKPLSLAGLAPAVGSVRDGTWPMARPLNLVTKRVPKGIAQAFIRFVLSPASRAAIVAHDFVPYLN